MAVPAREADRCHLQAAVEQSAQQSGQRREAVQRSRDLLAGTVGVSGRIRRHLGSGAKIALVPFQCDSGRNHVAHAAPRDAAGIAALEHERRSCSMGTGSGFDTGYCHGLR